MPAPFSTSHLQAIAAAIPGPALIVDAASIVVAANGAAGELLDGNPQGQHLAFSLRAPAILQTVATVLAEGSQRQAELHNKVPVPRSLAVHVSPLGADEAGRKLALIMLTDLTYQEQVERMRADFVANASHELRTPLTSITGFIETMQGPAKDDAAGRERFLALMKVQADRMARLIDDLLSLSRIEMNEHVQPADRVDLVSLVRQAGALLEPLAAAAGCRLNFDLAGTLQVRGNANELSQVICNLIENAIKYAGDGKAIDIRGRNENDEAVVQVIDHGPGIAPHHVPRLTERFYRVSAQDSRTRGGTGLGLAIVKHIVNRHRGRLSIESRLGHGSCFAIHLPIAI